MKGKTLSAPSGGLPRRSGGIGTVLLTIVISPPPTSFFDLTSEKSGSTPVVSQSIMKLIVPVGASTVACALRKPCTSPRSRTSSQALRQAASRSAGTDSACSKASTSSSPSSRRNFIRFSEARLQAESSIDMYSEHGLDALIREVFGSVCHLLIVVSY